jgi:hypothetical protein
MSTARQRSFAPLRQKPKKKIRMLDRAWQVDLSEISRVHDNYQTYSHQLSLLEKKYKITNYYDSRNLKNYPENERHNAARLWRVIESCSDDVDFLFIDEDLYPPR